MLYQITISKAGAVMAVVNIQADSALEAINRLDADREKLTIPISYGRHELYMAEWSGYEYEARPVLPLSPR
jgi:hypothetical protein